MRSELPRVLVIDDEPGLCRALARMLDRYLVDTCTDAIDALDRISTIDYVAIVCDIGLPRVSGLELYKLAIVERPNVERRFILMSGSAGDEALRGFPSARVLLKPFDRAELNAAIQAIVTGEARN